MNSIVLAQPHDAAKFHHAQSGEFLNGTLRITNSTAAMTEHNQILIFSNDDQKVVCSSIGNDPNILDRQESKLRVVGNLLEFAAVSQDYGFEEPNASSWIRIRSDALGKPELYINGRKGPSVSFAHVSGVTWGALCLTEAIVGIDAASSDEFPMNYPFHRAFHYEELSNAHDLTYGNISYAAALIWTAKEAVIKCIGTGFHMIDPLDLRIIAKPTTSESYDYVAHFDNKILRRLPELLENSITILPLTSKGLVISVAIMIKNGAADLYGARS
jgi:phosphopantetheinyl transferase